MPHVVILGAGFGGLTAAQALRRTPVRITLVDSRNHHLFQPLLYQVAMAGLSPADIAAPIRSVLRRQQNVTVLLEEAQHIDLSARTVHLTTQDEGAPVRLGASLSYDFLILATGAQNHYFGHPEWSRYAVGLKDLDDAVEIRRRVLLAFEAAERASTPAERRRLMTFVIVGGGPTGVELAGALAELRRFVLARDFRNINPADARVILIEGSPRILGTFPEKLARKAHRALVRKLGVEVLTNLHVTDINAAGVQLDQDFIPTATVVWAAGVAASSLTRTLGVPIDRVGRVLVSRELSVPDHPEVFVIGDAALFTHQGGQPLPGISPVAMQQARHVARNIGATLGGKPYRPFHYFDKGSMATIGRAAAIVHIGRLQLGGFFAWMLWLLVHIFFLITFRNRVAVLFNWAYQYFAYQRGARLITGHRLSEGPALPAPAVVAAPPASSDCPHPPS